MCRAFNYFFCSWLNKFRYAGEKTLDFYYMDKVTLNLLGLMLTFSSAVASLGRPNPQSSSTLFPPPPPLLNSAAKLFHCAIKRRLLPKGFHEVFMNSLGRHFFHKELLDNCSDFKFLHFTTVSHPPLLNVLYISNRA